MKIFLFLFLPLLIFSSAFAESGETIGEVVVTASRIAEPLEETTSSVTVINAEQIRRMEVDFVPDVLRRIPEINVIQNGGDGKTASVLLRGGSSAHTLVMIDGIRLNSTTTGSFDFSGINVDDIARIEIVKGPQSTIYGSEAMAGVVNIITKKGTGAPSANASLEAGSKGMFRGSAGVSGGERKINYRLTGTYHDTDGISAAADGSEDDGYRNALVSGNLGFRPHEKFEMEITGRYSYDKSELDGFDFLTLRAIDDDNFIQFGHHSLLAGKGKLYLTPEWEQILTLSRTWDSLNYRDPDDEFNNAEITTEIDAVDWHHNFYISPIFAVTAGAEYRNEKGENVGNFDESIDNKSLYLNNKVSLLDGTLILNAGLRYDDREDFGDKTTFKLGAVYLLKSLDMTFRGGYGTGFRAPAMNELFFPFYGNPDLKPEESTAWEFGMEKKFFGRLSLSVQYFNQDYDNLIDTSPLTFTAVNIDEAEVDGIETRAVLKISENIIARAGYTYLDAEDGHTGEELPLRPQDKITAAVEISHGNLTALIDYLFVAERFDSSVKKNLSSYSLVNLSGSYRIAKGLTVFGRIANLFDENYEETGSFGTPGLSVYGGIRAGI